MTTILGEETVTIERRSSSVVDAVVVASVDSTFSAELGLQPAPGRVVQLLPEALRTREAKIAYGDEEQPALRAGGVSGQLPDVVIRSNGDRYEVHGVQDWTTHVFGLPHRAYTLVRISDDES